MDEPLETTHTPDIVASSTTKKTTDAEAKGAGQEGGEEAASPGKSIAEIKKQMMKEQRENQ